MGSIVTRLSIAKVVGATEVEVKVDSQVVVNQLLRVYVKKVKI